MYINNDFLYLNKAEHESSTETRNTNGKGSFKKSSRVASQTPSLDAQAKIEKLDSNDELSFIPARDQEMTEVDQKLIFLTYKFIKEDINNFGVIAFMK